MTSTFTATSLNMLASDESVALTLKVTGKSSGFKVFVVFTIPVDGWIKKYPGFGKKTEQFMILLVKSDDMSSSMPTICNAYEYRMLQFSPNDNIKFNF